MTTAASPHLDIGEQLAHIDRVQAEIHRTQAELAAVKLETRFFPVLGQATLAAVALMATGAFIASCLG
jgi:hypothetical protein